MVLENFANFSQFTFDHPQTFCEYTIGYALSRLTFSKQSALTFMTFREVKFYLENDLCYICNELYRVIPHFEGHGKYFTDI